MKEFLYTHRMCCDKEYIWLIDGITRSFFRVNRKNFEVECILSSKELYGKNVFDIQKLLIWDDQIILLPLKINEEWIVFHKITRKAERFRPVDRSFHCVDAVQIENKIICIPASAGDPITVVDMQIWKCTNYITSWFHQMDALDFTGEIWDITSDENTVYFPIKNSQCVGMTDGLIVNIINFNIDGEIAAGKYYKEKWWILTKNTCILYCFDRFGNLLKKLFLEQQFTCIRIAVTDKYIFMLPGQKEDIQVFNIESDKLKRIEAKEKELPDLLQAVPYWYYYFENNCIIFLPHRYHCTIIDLDTLMVKYKEIVYPEKFVEADYWECYKKLYLSDGQACFYEGTGAFLQSFIQFAKNSNTMQKMKNNRIGEKIWNKMTGIPKE